jgi:hypothetical protein
VTFYQGQWLNCASISTVRVSQATIQVKSVSVSRISFRKWTVCAWNRTPPLVVSCSSASVA